MKHKIPRFWLKGSITLGSFLLATVASAQVIPDGTTSTTVNVDGNNFEINNGDRAGGNLFHSFQDFSVPLDGSAVFNNATDIVNIFSRVTGGSISDINGLIGANGSANLFLINPAGILFGENARLNIGGSFFGSTADSILFPDGEFSASDLNPPILTINAPIGLNFRDNPGDIVNRSLFTNDNNTPDNFDDDSLSGLEVPGDRTIGLIGGDLFIQGGFVTTSGGDIELGSVGGNSTVSLTEVSKGWDVSYEGIDNFGNIELSGAAFVTTDGANTGDIKVQGGNISLIEGSLLGITTSEGQAGNLTVIASESLSLDGNGIEVGLGDFATSLFSGISGEATGAGSQITLNTSQLNITNGAQITATVDERGQGVDIAVNAADIVVETPFINNELGISQTVGIFAQVGQNGFGDGGNITIETGTLTVNQGGGITTDTFGGGNAGNLTINASESIELTGTIPGGNAPSALSATVGAVATATGNAGNLTLNTPRLVVRDGAQISTVARNQGNGGTLTINASESILLTGTSPVEVLDATGRSGIFVSVQPAFEESGELIATTGNGGTVNLKTQDLTIEQGAFISINTFSEGNGGNGNINVNRLIVRDGGQIGAGSLIDPIGNVLFAPEGIRGDGGTLTINATESVEISGIGNINDNPVNSSLFTSAQSTGNAGDLTLNTDRLIVRDGGDINTSATGTGAAGNLTISANSLELDRGNLTATTAAGTGGNINLDIDNNITLRNESLISAAATGEESNGGNVTIVDSEFIIAYPSQGNGNDILASAIGGAGGNIEITAKSLLNIQEREASLNNETNDIDASSDFGVDGTVTINNPDVNPLQGETELSQNIIESEQTMAQACPSDRNFSRTASLVIKNKGGLPPEATEPFIADPILMNGQTSLPKPEAHDFEIKPIKTSIGDIYPARGIIKTQEGKIILTTYPTVNVTARTLNAAPNCDRT